MHNSSCELKKVLKIGVQICQPPRGILLTSLADILGVDLTDPKSSPDFVAASSVKSFESSGIHNAHCQFCPVPEIRAEWDICRLLASADVCGHEGLREQDTATGNPLAWGKAETREDTRVEAIFCLVLDAFEG